MNSSIHKTPFLEWLDYSINGIIIFMIIALLWIVVFKFFKKNKIKKEDDLKLDNNEILTNNSKFIAITSLSGIIAIFLGFYSNVLFENENNISNLLVIPFLKPIYLSTDLSKINNEEDQAGNYIFYIDNSGSSSIVLDKQKIPEWFNKQNIENLYVELGLPKNNNDPLIKKAESKKDIRSFDLLRVQALKVLLTLKGQESFKIVSFGNSPYTIFPVDNKFLLAIGNNKKYAAEKILKMTGNDADTDFHLLFNDVLKYDIKDRNNFDYKEFGTFIFSDLIHHVKINSNNKEEALKDSKNKIKDQLRRITQLNTSLGLMIFEGNNKNNDKSSFSIKNDIDTIFSENDIFYTNYTSDEFDKIIYHQQVSTQKIKMYYSDRIIDSAKAIIKGIPYESTENKKVEFILRNYPNTHFNQLHYRSNWEKEEKKTWKRLFANQKNDIPNTRNSDTFELKYSGSTYEQFPNCFLSIYIPEKKQVMQLEIIFVRRLPKLITGILIALLLILLRLESKYIYDNRKEMLMVLLSFFIKPKQKVLW